MLFSRQLFIAALAALTCSPAALTSPQFDRRASRRALLGFRTVHPEQAKNYVQANTVTADPNRDTSTGMMQLGRGVYVTPNLGGWVLDYGSHCAIFADEVKLDRLKKIRIPSSLFQQDKSDDVTEKIHTYIRKQIPGSDPNKVILIAHIDEGPASQMLIPFGLLNANGGDLDITVECAATKKELREKIKGIVSETQVDFQTWTEISGDMSDMHQASSSESESESDSDNEDSRPSSGPSQGNNVQVTDDRLHEPMDVDPNPEPMDIDPNPEPAPDRGEPMEVDLNENQLERLVSGNFAQLNCVTVLGAVLASSRTHHKRMLQSASTHETDSQADCEKARQILRQTPCREIKDLELGLTLSDDYWSGTYDRIEAILQGSAGRASLLIAEQPERGLSTWIPVDMKTSFGSETIDIGGINNVSLTAQGVFLKMFATTNDQFQVKDISLRALCSKPGFKLKHGRFNSLNKWYGHTPGKFLHPFSSFSQETVASFKITPADWQMEPPCAIIKELEYSFKVGDGQVWEGAGTSGSLSLTLGDGKSVPLGSDLPRGTIKNGFIALNDTFGSSKVDISNITTIALEGNVGTWLFDGISFSATCAHVPTKMQMRKFQSQNQWISESRWSQSGIVPGDWVEVA